MKLIEAAERLKSRGEITQEEFEIVKTAAKGPLVNIFTREGGKQFAGAASRAVRPVALGALGTVALSQLLKPAIEGAKARMAFSKLVEKNPALEGKDPEKIKDYFNVIKTFSPKAASNPLVAGSLVNKMMEFGGVDHKLVQDIAAIQSGVQSPSAIGELAGAAAKAYTVIPKEDLV